MRARTMILGWMVVMAGGCAMSHRDSATRGDTSVRTESIEEAWLAGEMAGVGRFDADAYEIEQYGSQITIHAGERGGARFGWVMIRLSAEGLAELPPGTVLTSATDVVGAVGCSGPSHGEWVFDGAAEQLTVEVEVGPSEDSRLVHFVANYEDGQRTEGGFVFRSPTGP